MKIAGDNRIISHFFRDEKSPVYTILYPPQHELKERYEMLRDLAEDMLVALKQEDVFREEHKKYLEDGGEIKEFSDWMKDKAVKAQEAEKAKAKEVKEVPVEEAVVEEIK